eukprot:comp19575_c0_seq1/m.23007 comp19575_c0_seq1/g.23007  ORF comp19575_c0_seq1/g.23007 comp19575_c0_seq1/m.23007 type:complete len:542 (-) comp19575_c0_seq1:400-2025(-)
MAGTLTDPLSAHLSSWPLKVEERPGFGRYIRATRNIDRGEVVLQARAYMVNVSESFRKRVCAFCFTHQTAGRLECKCGGCNRAYYCNEECRSAHVKVHSKLCTVCSRLSSAKFDHDVTSTLQFVIEMLARQHCEKLGLSEDDFLPPLPKQPPPPPTPTPEIDDQSQDSSPPSSSNQETGLGDKDSPSDSTTRIPESGYSDQRESDGASGNAAVILDQSASAVKGDRPPNRTDEPIVKSNLDASTSTAWSEIENGQKPIEGGSEGSEQTAGTSNRTSVGKKVKWVDLDMGGDLEVGRRQPPKTGQVPVLKYTPMGLQLVYDSPGTSENAKGGVSKEVENGAEGDSVYSYTVDESRLYVPNVEDYLSLVHHSAAMEKEQRDEWRKAYKYLLGILEKAGLGLPAGEEEMYALIGRLEANGFGFLDPRGTDMKLAGRLVFPAASFFNHSCDPNLLVRGAESTVISLVAERDICEGSELNIHYIDINLPRPTRRQKLLQDYMFECACPRCEEEKEAGNTAPPTYHRSKNNSKKQAKPVRKLPKKSN